MLRLWRRFNYRLAELGADAFVGQVRVLEADGSSWLAEWQGFVSASAARLIEGARPVRLVVEIIESTNPSGYGRRRLAADEYVQGCAVEQCAWAVVDQRVRIVTGPERERGS